MPQNRSYREKTKVLLDEAKLRSLALFYVGRYATTRAKLSSYLNRKVGERGWGGAQAPDIDSLIDQITALGYVDDEAFAVARAATLVKRGYGAARVRAALGQAGIAPDQAQAISALNPDQAMGAILRFAARKRIGPFASAPQEPRAQNRALSALLRAGHSFENARKLLSLSADDVLNGGI